MAEDVFQEVNKEIEAAFTKPLKVCDYLEADHLHGTLVQARDTMFQTLQYRKEKELNGSNL